MFVPYYCCHIPQFLILIFAVKPEVRPVPDNGIIVATSGSSVELNCEVTRGSPAPEMTWHRKERKMPTGKFSKPL